MSKTARGKAKTENPESEWFGFKRVRPEDKTGMVQDIFASVAGNYDLMNDLMSGGLHRLWKDYLVREMRPRAGQTLLDVAGGTGDIALRCWKKAGGKAKIIVCDLNPAMLEEGRAKAINQGILPAQSRLRTSSAKRVSGAQSSRADERANIEFITGNAEDLPIPSRSVDTYSIAFGLRNVTRIDKALAEAARVLKPGGRFFCMEFSPGVVPMLKPVYEQYCLHILPWIGEHVAGDREAYRYLAESILRFPPQEELAKRMEKAGLAQATWTNLTGGIAVIHSGWKL